MTVCRDCGAKWFGLRVCHCAACHVRFETPAAFDAHRVRGKCPPPIAKCVSVRIRSSCRMPVRPTRKEPT
ncbi:FDXHR family putative zinc-binding protein [Rhodococcus sp. NPDC055024]